MNNQTPYKSGPVRIGSFCSSGYHTDEHGIGSTDISVRKTDGAHIDLIDVFFTAHTQAVLEKQLKITPMTKACADMKRRLSQKQADYIKDFIIAKLNEEFSGVIPGDDTIDSLRASRPMPAPQSTILLFTQHYALKLNNGKISVYEGHPLARRLVTVIEDAPHLATQIDEIFNRRFGLKTHDELIQKLDEDILIHITALESQDAAHGSK